MSKASTSQSVPALSWAQRATAWFQGLLSSLADRERFSTTIHGKLSLSRYFPRGTDYYYGYPAGTGSKFYNPASPWLDELGAGRPLMFAGPTVNIVTFASSVDPEIWSLLTDELGLTIAGREQVLPLPASITPKLTGEVRNRRIIKALAESTGPGKLVMAQPYIDPQLEEHYRIAPEIVTSLNDKQSIPKYVPVRYRPLQYSLFETGREFAASNRRWPFPCVVKVTSSSSGDGVRICFDRASLQAAKNEFKVLDAPISIEEFVLARQNIGVLFGVPQNQNYPIEIIGHHLQVTTDQGGFLGALFNVGAANDATTLPLMYQVMSDEVLSRVRTLGWYGIGGVDVLFDQRDRFYIIDANFRVTAATAYSFYLKNEGITTPLLSFTGMFTGSLDEFKKRIVPLARPGRQRELLIVSMARDKHEVRFNGGMFFESEAELYERANRLKQLGVTSELFDHLHSLRSLRNVFRQ